MSSSRAAAVLGVAALIAAASFYSAPSRRSARRPAPRHADVPPEYPLPEPSASGEGSSRLFSTAAAAGPMTLDEFLGTLETETPETVVDKFVAAFNETPELTGIWSAFLKRQGIRAPASRLLEELGSKESFRRLVARFRSDPEAQAAWAQLSVRPDVGRALADAGEAGARIAAAASAGGSGRAGRSGVLLAYAGRAGTAGRGGTHGPAPALALAAAPSVTARREAVLNLLKDKYELRPRERAGAGAHKTAPLAKLAEAKTETTKKLLEIYPWLGSLTDAQREGIAANAEHGIWGACFKLDSYAACEAACGASQGKCAAPAQGGWAACLELYGDTSRCLTECPRQPGCRPPGGTTASAAAAPLGAAAPMGANAEGAEPPERPEREETDDVETIRVYGNDGLVYDIPLNFQESMTLEQLYDTYGVPNP